MRRGMAMALSVMAFGCSKADPTPQTTEAPQQEPPPVGAPLTGIALADAYKACAALINDAKFDDYKKDCVEADFTSHAVAGTPEVKGVDDLVGFYQSRKTGMPDWTIQPQLVLVSGRNILAVDMVTGTHTGTLKTSMGDLPATNKKVGQLMFHRLVIDDANHVTDEWAYADEATMLAQLGAAAKGTPPKRPALDKGWEGAPIVVVSADDAKEKANLTLVQNGNDAFIANQPAETLAMYSDDINDMSQRGADDIRDIKELEKGLVAFRNMWSDVNVANLEVWAAGDYVVQSFTFEGKSKKGGAAVDFDVAQVMHVEDGKVNQLWEF